MSGPGIANSDDEDDFDRLFKKTVEVEPSKEDDFDRLFKQTVSGPDESTRVTAEMPDRQAAQPLVQNPDGPSLMVSPKPLTEESKNPNDPPTSDGWIGALTDAFRKTMPGSVLGEGVKNPAARAGALGLSHAMTMGVDQNIPGYGEFIQGERAQAKGEVPAAYNVSDAVGMAMNPANALGSGVLGNAAVQGLIGSTRSKSDGSSWADALKDGAIDAGGSTLVGGMARGLGETAGGVANTARRAAWGIGSQEAKNFAARTGLPVDDAKKMLVQEGERIMPPNFVVPRGSGDWEKAGRVATSGDYKGMQPSAIERAANWVSGKFGGQQIPAKASGGLNEQIEDTVDAATAAGARMPTDPRGQIANDLYHQGTQAKYSGFGTDMEAPLKSVAQGVERGPQSTTPMDLRAQKIGFDKRVFGGADGSAETMRGQANLAAGNQYRDMLGNYVAQGGDDLANQFARQSNDFGIAATVRDAAATAAAGNGASGQGGGLADRALSMVPGSGQIADGIANVGRLGERVTNWIGNIAPNAVTRMREQMIPDPRMQGGPSSMNAPTQGMAPPDAGRDDAQPGPATPQWYNGGRQGNSSMGPVGPQANSSSASRSIDQLSTLDDSTGQNLTQNFVKLLRTQPELFSQWGTQIDNEIASEDQISPWIQKMNFKDPQFARDIYPMLASGKRST